MVSSDDWQEAAASRFRPEGTVGTPFHSRTARSSATPWYFNWDLHHVVDEYTDFHDELATMRSNVTMGDMSPLCKAMISGPDAHRMVDVLIPRAIDEMAVNTIFYTPWCNDDGKVVSDGLVFRTAEDRFRFTGDPTVDWFMSKAEGFDVSITEETDDYGILAVQGPNSRAVVEAAVEGELGDIGFSRLALARIAGVDVEIARQGFTGEHGYEILVPREGGPAVWDAIADAGEPLGIKPCGEWAIDVARVEAGFLIPGPDYANAGPDPTGSHTVSAADPDCFSSPYELGMGNFVDLDKPYFVGRQALVAEQESGGAPRALAGLEIDWRAVVDAHVERGLAPNVSSRVQWVTKPVSIDGEIVGRASSITWGPTVGALIGFGHLRKDLAEAGQIVAVDWTVPGSGDVVPIPAAVVSLPFLARRRT